MAITDYKISDVEKGEARLFGRVPDRLVGSAGENKQQFDMLGELITGKYNDALDAISSSLTTTNTKIDTARGDLEDEIAAAEGQQGPPGERGEQGIQGEQGPQGIQGVPGQNGADGRSFIVHGIYATISALETAHPTGEDGDAWLVGDADDNTVYLWDIDQESWEDVGALAGPQGLQGPQGVQGATGATGTVVVDTVINNTSTNPVENKTIYAALQGKEDAITPASAFNKSFESVAANLQMDGTAAAGSSNKIPRADHVHPTDTSRASQSDLDALTAAVTLTGATAARLGLPGDGTASIDDGFGVLADNIEIDTTAVSGDDYELYTALGNLSWTDAVY